MSHSEKKLVCLLFSFGIVSTADEDCEQQLLTVAFYLQLDNTGGVTTIVLGLKQLRTNAKLTRGQSNLTKSASRGAHSPVRGHPRGSKVVPLNSWGRVSY